MLTARRERTGFLRLGLAFAAFGCSRDPIIIGNPTESSTDVTTSAGSRGESDTTSTTLSAEATSSGASSSDSVAADGTSSGSSSETGDNCPAADPTIVAGTVGFGAPDWPDTPVETVCEALSLEPYGEEDAGLHLQLSCLHPETGRPADVLVAIGASGLAGKLDHLVGTAGLQVSFRRGWSHITIRDAAGDLVFLDYTEGLGPLLEGEAHEVGRPPWLEPGTPEHDAWAAPFGAIMARHVGCEPRDPLDDGPTPEIPLAVELEADAGPVSVYYRNIESGIEIGGQRFDVVVYNAFLRRVVECIKCEDTEVSFKIVRSLE